MNTIWTAEQILALAPDPASAKAGRGLASPQKWVSTGKDERALWGECQGSGSRPYQTQIDLSEPAFRCSCPSRKFPCKHGLGLFLLFAGDTGTIPETPPPAWVTDWLAKRQEKTQKQTERRPESEKTAEEQAKTAQDQAKRAASREKKVAQGVQDLHLWLQDLMRQGLATLPTRPYRFWDEAVARLVDAQAPGLARWLREMGGIPNSGEGWIERLMERIGLLTLVIEGYQRLDSLPEPHQVDIRTAIGWTVRQEEVLSAPGARDRWLVLGQRVSDEEQFKVQRTWLLGQNSRRPALLLHFTRPGQPLDVTLVPNTAFDAELAFFPSAYPLRALLKVRCGDALPLTAASGFGDFAEMLGAYADALACVPWLEAFPAALEGVIPVQDGGRRAVRDREGKRLPLRAPFAQGWPLLAVSGGHPVTLFGEWDGASLLPVSAWAEGRFTRL
jgi:hypothetical protein